MRVAIGQMPLWASASILMRSRAKERRSFMITAIGTPVLLNEINHIQAEAVDGDIDGSVIKNKVKASLIIERYTGIYIMDNVTAEFIATSRLTEFVPLLFKAMNLKQIY